MLSIIVSMFLYQAAASAPAQTPDLVALEIEVQRVRLQGRVTRAGEGVAAALDFVPSDLTFAPGTKPTPASAESGTSGDYEARVWPGAIYRVRVTPSGGDSSPSRFQFLTGDAPEQEKDFALSANTLKVTFRDAKSHAPIPGAKLVHIDSEGSQSSVADQNGDLTIESVPAGAFHGTAVAKEYVNASADWAIEDRDEPQPFEIDLSPKAEGNDFQVFLPDGSPAAAAFGYYRFNPVTGSRNIFQCDQEGICHPPEKPGDAELVYLSHAAAGLTILPAGRIYEADSAVLLPAGGPLVVRIKPESKSSEKCEFGVVTIQSIPIEQTGHFTCGAEPWPLEFTGLPAGQVEVKIVSRELDDHGRYSADTVLAGSVAVVLPSDPIEIAIP